MTASKESSDYMQQTFNPNRDSASQNSGKPKVSLNSSVNDSVMKINNESAHQYGNNNVPSSSVQM